MRTTMWAELKSMNAHPGKRRFWRTEAGMLVCEVGPREGWLEGEKTETARVPGRLGKVRVLPKMGSDCSSLKSQRRQAWCKGKFAFFEGWQQS